MTDETTKRKGPPFSLSRKEEQKNKHRTIKARRQAGRKAIAAALTVFALCVSLAHSATPVEVIAAPLVLEAGGEGRRGMEAVREVIVNRAIAKGTNQLAIVLKPRQFSCWNGRPLAAGVSEAKRSAAWPCALAIATGPRTSHVGPATHYIAPRLASAAWARGRPLATVGRHAFFAP